MLDLNKYINLLPDAPFDNSVGSNNYKIIELLVEELNDLVEVFEEIAGLTDLDNMYGETLTMYADGDYGIDRDGRTDEQLRVLVRAKQISTIDGNTISKAINYFDLFIDPATDIVLTELFISSLGFYLDGLSFLDGTRLLSGAGLRRSAAFDVNVKPPSSIPPTLENDLTSALQILKGAGIQATLGLVPP
jgi:hypothetical protein